MEQSSVKHPGLKMISAWLSVYLSYMWQSFTEVPWEILAQFAAFIYSCALILEWVIKRFRSSDRGTS